MLPEALLYKLEHLPAQPGCYLFKDKKGVVVYVGKAKSLRSRVRSYFQESSGDERYFIPLLQRTVGDLETLVTASEKEAAILEDSLIKEHQPRYNVKLRDDKSFLCLRIDLSHEWPRVQVCRRPAPDGARYFGPYHSATAARRTLHLVNKYFQLRTCSDQDLQSRKRPCLQFQIRRCLAPCVYEVDKQWYADQVRAVGLFLDGRHDELSKELLERMKAASKSLEFELAATYRDQLRAVEAIRQEQRVVAVKDVDQDVVGLYREGDLVQIAVLFIRSGKVTDTAHFPMRGVELPDEEVTAAFVAQYYAESGSAITIPDEVVVPALPDGAEGVADWLSERRGKKSELLHPQRGPRADLLRMANENAEHAFREQRRAQDDVDDRLAQIQKRLRLPTLPRRIECCDISHLGGNDTVGAIVALLDGQPDKTRYRTYIVRGGGAGDDYQAMFEVLSRRFRRGKQASESESESDSEWQLPDLFVVDGGRGQLGIALAAAHDLGLHDLHIVGLAKEKENVLGDKLTDRVYLPGQKNPIALRPNSPELFLLARARDEAHRFSNRGRTKVGKRRRFESELDSIAGIGPKTRTALLKTLGSVAALREATDAAILGVPGVTQRHLQALRAASAASAAPPEDEDDAASETTPVDPQTDTPSAREATAVGSPTSDNR